MSRCDCVCITHNSNCMPPHRVLSRDGNPKLVCAEVAPSDPCQEIMRRDGELGSKKSSGQAGLGRKALRSTPLLVLHEVFWFPIEEFKVDIWPPYYNEHFQVQIRWEKLWLFAGSNTDSMNNCISKSPFPRINPRPKLHGGRTVPPSKLARPGPV